jgi:hypothetical protein
MRALPPTARAALAMASVFALVWILATCTAR